MSTLRSCTVLLALALLLGSVSSVLHMASHLAVDGHGESAAARSHHLHAGPGDHAHALADQDGPDATEANSCLVYHAFMGMSAACCDSTVRVADALAEVPDPFLEDRATLDSHRRSPYIRGPPYLS